MENQNTTYNPPILRAVVPNNCPPTKVDGLDWLPNYDKQTANLYWSRSSDESLNGKAGIDYYVIYVDGQEAGRTDELDFTTGVLEPGEHSFSIIAYDLEGNASEESDICSFEILDGFAPETGELTVEQTSASTVQLTTSGFTDNVKVTYYSILVNGEIIEDAYEADENEQLSYTYAQDILPIEKIKFSVIAWDGDGRKINESEEVSKTITIKDITPPDNIDIESITAEQTKGKYTAVLKWAEPYDNTGIDYYMIYLDDDEDGIKSTKPSYTTKALDIGTHTVKIVAYDEDGNRSVNATETEFEIKDATAPKAGKVKVKQIPNEYALSVELTGWSDNHGISDFVFTIDGENMEAALSEDMASATITLDESYVGKQSITVTAWDADGNESKAVKANVTVKDTTPPEDIESIDAEQTKGKYTAKLTWDVPSDNSDTDRKSGIAYYMVYLDDDEDGIKSTKPTYTTKALDIGNHTVKIVAYDIDGNRSVNATETEFEIKDATAPKAGKVKAEQIDGTYDVKIALTGWSDNVGIENYIFTLDGEEVDAELSLDGSSAILSLDGTYAGRRSLTVTAVDTTGNESKAVKATVTIEDMVAPEAPDCLYAIQNAGEMSAELHWGNAVDDSGEISHYMVYIDGATRGTKVTGNTFSTKDLDAGAHSFHVVAYDGEGNASSESITAGFQILEEGESSVFDLAESGDILPVGSELSDLAIAKSGTECEAAMIALGDGDDNLVIEEGAYLSFGMIDMNVGNDILSIGRNVALSGLDESSQIAMGDGSDTLTFNGSSLNVATINMGNGDNLVSIGIGNLAEDSDYSRTLTFGSGNDTLIFNGGNGETDIFFAEIQFGNGNNSLAIQEMTAATVDTLAFGSGTDSISIGAGAKLTIQGEFNADALESLEIAANGVLEFNDLDSYNSAKNKFESVSGNITLNPAIV